MITYVLRRLAAGGGVLFLASLIVFSMLYFVPGDPVDIMVLEHIGMTPERREALRHELGLDRPFWERYADHFWKLFHGDLGRSLVYSRPVIELITHQLPATFELAIAAMFFAMPLGLLLGIIAAVYRNSWIDTLSMSSSIFGISVPQFWMGLMLILIFSIHLGLVPPMGSEGINTLVLPAITLSVGPLALIARLTRSSMLEVLGLDYITTARSKGLIERRVVLQHALRNAFLPVLTLLGIQMGTLLSGTIIIETVFARQGLGKLLVDSIIAKDFPVVQAIILLIATVYTIINLCVDLLYTVVDPTVRIGGDAK